MQEQTFKIIAILAMQQGTSERGDWQSQEVIIEAQENVQYPDRHLLTLRGDKVKMLDGIKVGDEVTAQWSANVRDWKTRDGKTAYSQVNNCWKIALTAKEDKPF